MFACLHFCIHFLKHETDTQTWPFIIQVSILDFILMTNVSLQYWPIGSILTPELNVKQNQMSRFIIHIGHVTHLRYTQIQVHLGNKCLSLRLGFLSNKDFIFLRDCLPLDLDYRSIFIKAEIWRVCVCMKVQNLNLFESFITGPLQDVVSYYQCLLFTIQRM